MIKRGLQWFGVSICLLSIASSPAYAQKSAAERIDDLEKKLEQSLKQIEQLSQEVSQLRGTKPQAAQAV